MSPRILLPLALLGLCTEARGIIIRDLDFATNVRLAWMPDLHEENDAFPMGIANVRGIGWPEESSGEWHRQMALISPYHFLFATHYAVDSSWQLSFELPDGTLVNRRIASTTPVKNADGENSDILLGTLQDPVLAEDTGITPFPIANLGADANYLGLRGWSFGKVSIAGRGNFSGFGYVNDTGFTTTRYIYFDYSEAGTAADDCYYEDGDSGSPTFIVENGLPSLIGTHSYEDDFDNDTVHRNYDAFLPDYLPEMDAMMEAQGYHVTRSHPEATSLSIAASSAPLFSGQAATAIVSIANTGAADAHNLSLTLDFNRAPATVSGDGWICQQLDPYEWQCRKGGVAKSAAGPLTVSWASTGEDGTIRLTGSLNWDGGSAQTLDTTLPVGPVDYAAWTGSMDQSGLSEDPDRDGIENLLEYAFGGDPLVSSTTAIGGYPLLPRITGGNYLFAKRTDAAQRGLIYHIECSTDLVNWAEDLPPGVTAIEAPLTPPVSGFDQVTVSAPPASSSARWFYRVRVEINP